ncbi:hypothetical protein [Paenibacillus sp. SI8]|uniref:hypothetical protein n=1 Tax=unclassified Paenibacillus TaxID=185978 RepID=UPI00346592B4
MLHKIGFLLVVYVGILLYDIPGVKKGQPVERLSYLCIMLITVYLSLDFIMDKHWPDLNTLIDYILKPPADRIVKWLKPTP